MKILVLTSLLLSFSSFASVPVVTAQHMTCSELNQMLTKHGELIIKRKVLGFSRNRRVAVSISCSDFYHPSSAVFKTLDVRYCIVGEYCQPEHNNGMGGDLGGPN